MERRINPASVRMLTARDLAEVVGNLGLAYRLFNTQGFPTIRLGKRVLVREESLYAWLRANEGQRVDVTPAQ
ncbi:MAG: helix-turn-helix domain-containing protein [Oscillospiraceae bacterium]|jgi:hypothetical protein|nr:helix-turn-helix domain-containing protein [Oscillospiraceae bacterium]